MNLDETAVAKSYAEAFGKSMKATQSRRDDVNSFNASIASAFKGAAQEVLPQQNVRASKAIPVRVRDYGPKRTREK